MESGKVAEKKQEKTEIQKGLGLLITIDLFGCNKDLCRDDETVLSMIRTAVKVGHDDEIKFLPHKIKRATGINVQDVPEGISVIVSSFMGYISCRTYADAGMIVIDILTYGEETKPRAIVNFVLSNFVHTKKEVKYIERLV